MNVSCPECRSVFRLDPAKITSVAMRARCSVCGGLIPVGAAVNWGDDLQGSAAATSSAPAMGKTPSGVKPMLARAGTPAPSGAAASWPPPVPRAEAPPSAQAVPPNTAPPAPKRAEAPAPPPRPRTPPFSPRSVPAVPREQAPAPRVESSPAVTMSASFGAPLTPPSRTVIPEPPSPPAKGSPTPPAFAAGVAAAFSTPSTPTPPPAVVQRKPINPFLANDPNQKARRLARALVSDMVAYNPSKRDEGLQGGTLKQLFRDEIKKSYEEYVEQVGREFAESTVHFQEALNDVLAAGRKVF